VAAAARQRDHVVGLERPRLLLRRALAQLERAPPRVLALHAPPFLGHARLALPPLLGGARAVGRAVLHAVLERRREVRARARRHVGRRHDGRDRLEQQQRHRAPAQRRRLAQAVHQPQHAAVAPHALERALERGDRAHLAQVEERRAGNE